MRKASIIRVIGEGGIINIRQHLIRFDHARARNRYKHDRIMQRFPYNNVVMCVFRTEYDGRYG